MTNFEVLLWFETKERALLQIFTSTQHCRTARQEDDEIPMD